MIIVSDTTILSTLYLVDKLYWLKDLFGEIIIPNAVYEELLELEAAGYNIKTFHESQWILVKTVKNQDLIQELTLNLDKGESEAIAIALENNADFLLIDERKGSQKANELGIATLGLLRVILELKEKGLISSVKPVLYDIQQKGGFWMSQELYKKVLEAAGE